MRASGGATAADTPQPPGGGDGGADDAGRKYEELMDEHSGHYIVIRKGETLDSTPEFESWQRVCAEQWPAVASLLLQIEAICVQYDVPTATVDGRKLAALAEEVDAGVQCRLEALLACIENIQEVAAVLQAPGQRFRGPNGRDAAAVVVQAYLRGRLARRVRPLRGPPVSTGAPPPRLADRGCGSENRRVAAWQLGAERCGRAVQELQRLRRRNEACRYIQAEWRLHRLREGVKARLRQAREERAAAFAGLQRHLQLSWDDAAHAAPRGHPPALALRPPQPRQQPARGLPRRSGHRLALREHLRGAAAGGRAAAAHLRRGRPQGGRALCRARAALGRGQRLLAPAAAAGRRLAPRVQVPRAAQLAPPPHTFTRAGLSNACRRVCAARHALHACRYRVVYPENSQRLPTRMSLTAKLLASPRALRRLLLATRDRAALLVPSAVTDAEIELAVALNVPLLGAAPPVAAAVQSKAGARALFQHARMNVSPGVAVPPVEAREGVASGAHMHAALAAQRALGTPAPPATVKLQFSLEKGNLVVQERAQVRGGGGICMHAEAARSAVRSHGASRGCECVQAPVAKPHERKDRFLCEHIAKAMLQPGAKTIQVRSAACAWIATCMVVSSSCERSCTLHRSLRACSTCTRVHSARAACLRSADECVPLVGRVSASRWCSGGW